METINVPVEIIEKVCKYCEDKQIYDKLGYYGDFYYKFKKMIDKDKRYSVFKVDICLEPYAIEYIYVGAENIVDLKYNLKDILKEYGLEKNEIVDIISDSDIDRIKKIDGLYADKPYVILDSVYYSE